MNNYVKVRKIGEGAFGKAHLVKKKQGGQQFVIKEISISRMSPKEREESRKEVAVLSQLSHPNIVTYRASFEEAGNLYIVMDYCSGGDLYSKINSQRGILFPEDQILDWFVQICLALKHIHDRKILHRDIKSQNIFLMSNGSVQLGDFGIAKVLNNTAELARTCIGTPYYLSPEIVENKPYNNKSDVWSLGCVLYEVTTLKHAFEAGNMKNLVLKIIRGSYPPIAPKYSYDLRGLVAQLFKRAPRDRPSINSILRKNFIQKRCSKFLTDAEMQAEFSHTIIHGKKLGRPLPPPPAAAAGRPSSARRPPPAAKPSPRYDPAAVYGAPVRKSKDMKAPADAQKRPGSAGSNRPGSAGRSRPGSAGANRPVGGSYQDLQQKRRELVEKERKRKLEEQRNEQDKRHRDLMEKQKLARMNKAREEGWKGLINSVGSDDGEQKERREQGREQVQVPAAKPAEERFPLNDPLQDRGNYEEYHAYLDKIQAKRPNAPGNPAMPNWRQQEQWRPQAHNPIQRAEMDRRLGGQAAERARIMDDFIQRKKEAAMNKARGQAELYGRNTPIPRPDSGRAQQQQQPKQGGGVPARNKEEQDYLEKLRQIRQHNYQERRNIQGRAMSPREEADARKEKIEALRKQADDRAQLLKDQLELKRKDLLEKERRMWENQGRGKPGERPPVQAKPDIRPGPPVAMTGALAAIGVQPKVPSPAVSAAPPVAMTGVLAAIGADPRKSPEQAPPAEPVQVKDLQQKDDKEAQRAQWGAPGTLHIAQPNDEEVPDTSRSKWGGGEGKKLGDLPLEQTASQMEATSARDQVICNPVNPTEAAEASSRRQWGKPSGSVVNALKNAPIATGTVTVSTSGDSQKSPPPATPPKPQVKPKPSIGYTIKIETTPDGKEQLQTEGLREETPTPDPGKKSDASATVSTSTNQEPRQGPDSEPEPPKPDLPQSPDTVSQSDHRLSPELKAADTANSTETVTKPPTAAKPQIGFQTITLPKPVLLQKPDTPFIFEKQNETPEAVKSEGPGGLFDKVELEEEEEDKKKPKNSEKEEVQKDEKVGEKEKLAETGQKEKIHRPKTSSGLVEGLTTGHFDMGNAKLLRTCSEPDLMKITRSMAQTPDIGTKPRRSSVDLGKVDEEEESARGSMDKSVDGEEEDNEHSSPGSRRESERDGEADVEDDEDDEDDEDLDDLLSVRETMQSLLLDDNSSESESERKGVQFSLSRESGEGDDEDTEDKSESDEKNGEGAEEDKNDARDGASKSMSGISIDSENPSESTTDDRADTLSELFLSDDSEEYEENGDDDYDLFNRLEESRMQLETELGCDVFLKIYKTVQALQEDEDESIEEGTKIALDMLGKEKEHLYPKIFQLVMADSAFTDDNAG